MGLFEKIKTDDKNFFDYISKFKNVSQKHGYDCGPAAVSMFLSFYGINIKREDLVELLKTNKDGTDWMHIENYFLGLKNFELKQEQHNIDAAKEYIKKNFPLFICWNMDYTESHYSILLTLDKPKIHMLDPSDKIKITPYDYNYFIDCWKLQNCWFAVLIPEGKETLTSINVEKYLSGDISP